MDPATTGSLKTWAEIASATGSLLALVAAAVWFVRTSKFRQRIQFDVDLKTYPLPANPAMLVGEVQFILENKGFVEHRIYNLTLSLHSLESDAGLETREGTGELLFGTPILRKTELVPPSYTYYFVRPGVRQVITHIVSIPAVPVIRVTAGFAYQRNDRYPHTVRRVFPVLQATPVLTRQKA
jgi:hypothetical protein